MNHGGITAAIYVCLGFATVLAQLRDSRPRNTSTTNGTCDFSGLDFDAMIEAFINELPAEHTDEEYDRYELIPGVSIGGSALYAGLNRLLPFGPVLAYCRDGSHFVQVDLAVSRDNVRVVLPWSTCEEARGAIGGIARLKVTVTFQVQNATDKDASGTFRPKLTLHDGPMPVFADDVYVFLEGTGTFLDRAVPIIGKLLSGLSKDAYLFMIKPAMQQIFKNITLSS